MTPTYKHIRTISSEEAQFSSDRCYDYSPSQTAIYYGNLAFSKGCMGAYFPTHSAHCVSS